MSIRAITAFPCDRPTVRTEHKIGTIIRPLAPRVDPLLSGLGFKPISPRYAAATQHLLLVASRALYAIALRNKHWSDGPVSHRVKVWGQAGSSAANIVLRHAERRPTSTNRRSLSSEAVNTYLPQ